MFTAKILIDLSTSRFLPKNPFIHLYVYSPIHIPIHWLTLSFRHYYITHSNTGVFSQRLQISLEQIVTKSFYLPGELKQSSWIGSWRFITKGYQNNNRLWISDSFTTSCPQALFFSTHALLASLFLAHSAIQSQAQLPLCIPLTSQANDFAFMICHDVWHFYGGV